MKLRIIGQSMGNNRLLALEIQNRIIGKINRIIGTPLVSKPVIPHPPTRVAGFESINSAIS